MAAICLWSLLQSWGGVANGSCGDCVLFGLGWPIAGCGGGVLWAASKFQTSARSSPSEVYPTGKLHWHFTCGFDFRLPFLAAFAVQVNFEIADNLKTTIFSSIVKFLSFHNFKMFWILTTRFKKNFLFKLFIIRKVNIKNLYYVIC